MAELINLKPLFPGVDGVDQVAEICEILGDPSDDYYPISGDCSTVIGLVYTRSSQVRPG